MNINNYLSAILLITTFLLLFVGVFAWRRNKRYVSVSLLPVSIYAFGYAFEILCSNIEEIKFWIKVEYLGIPFLGVVWLMCALNFTGYKDKFNKSTLKLMYIIPIIILILNYTNDFHHLFYKKLYMDNNGFFPIVEIVQGPWYWVNIAYTYLLMITGLIIFIIAYLRTSSIIRKQISLILVAWIIPWISDIIYMFKLLPFDIDLFPFALSFSGIVCSIAILKFKLLKLTPIALEKVFSNTLEGVIVLDAENNIVNFNNAAKNIISELQNIEAGDKKIDEALKEYKSILNALNNAPNNESIVSIKDREQLKYYNINISNVYESIGGGIGKILILNDITEFELQREKLSDNLKFIETLIDAIPNPIYSKDEYGAYNHINTAFTEFLGIRYEKLIGNTVFELFDRKSAEIYDKADKNLIDCGGTQTYESKLMHKDGTYHDVIFNKSLVVNKQGNNKGLVGVIVDITEQRKNQEKISKLLTLKEAMLNIGYCINEISNINDLLQLILDKVINCIDPKSCGSVLLLDNDKNLKIAVAKGFKPEDIKNFKIKQDDSWYSSNLNKSAIFNNIDKMKTAKVLDTAEGMKIKSSISSPIMIDGQFYGFLNIDSVYSNFFDEVDLELMEYMKNQVSIAISKHKLYEETIYLSRYDKLTDVYNRNYFEQLLSNNICNDNTDKKIFYATVFDLNGLKFVNDNYGHLVGDELIKAFSNGLKSLARHSDIIGRFGGDEFVGVFFDTDSQSLINRFEELIEHFKNNPIISGENKIICSYSYGIANFPTDGREYDQLIKIADKRMYEYKNILKNM